MRKNGVCRLPTLTIQKSEKEDSDDQWLHFFDCFVLFGNICVVCHPIGIQRSNMTPTINHYSVEITPLFFYISFKFLLLSILDTTIRDLNSSMNSVRMTFVV